MTAMSSMICFRVPYSRGICGLARITMVSAEGQWPLVVALGFREDQLGVGFESSYQINI